MPSTPFSGIRSPRKWAVVLALVACGFTVCGVFCAASWAAESIDEVDEPQSSATPDAAEPSPEKPTSPQAETTDLDDALLDELDLGGSDDGENAGKRKPESDAPKKPESDEPPSDEPALDASGLDAELFRELGGDDLVPGGLPAKPSKKPSGDSQQPPSGDEPGKSTGKGTGEDVGQSGGGESTLVRIAELMQQAQSRLAATDSGDSTQKLQQNVIEDLDKLIAQARQAQKKGGGGGSSQNQASTRSQASKPGAQPGQAAANSGRQPNESTERLGKAALRSPTDEEAGDLIKRFWGDLPERDREQLMQSMIEGFLPKYEFHVKDYFRRLSEDDE